MKHHSFFLSIFKVYSIMFIEKRIEMKNTTTRSLSAEDIREITTECEDVLPELSSLDFICAFLGMMRLRNMREFEVLALTSYLENKFLESEYLRVTFWDVTPRTVVYEGISFLSIVGGVDFCLENSAKARIRISKETTEQFIQKLHPTYRGLITELVHDFLNPELNVKLERTKKQ